MKTHAAVATLVLVLGVHVRSLMAQQESPKSRSTGLFIGGGAERNVVSARPFATGTSNEHVAGQGIVVGYGFTQRWSLYAHAGEGSFQTGSNSTSAGSFDAGVRMHFGSGSSAIVPFLQGGVSNRVFSSDALIGGRTENLMSYRYLPSAGPGVNLHVTPGFAFSASALWSAGRFTQADGSRKLGVTSPLLHLGLLVFPRF